MTDNDSMREADARIYAATKTLLEMAAKPNWLIGLDFADIRSVLDRDWGAGIAVCGHGTASGPDRATKAAEAALADVKDQLAALHRP